MRVICITGPIASGKTRSVHILQEKLRLPAIKMDYIGHFILTTPFVIEKIIYLFGEQAIVDGKVSRRYIASKIFSDQLLLQQYNSFIHPLMKEEAVKLINIFSNLGFDTVLLEAALLFDAKWESLCSEIWSVISPVKAIYSRLGAQKFHKFYLPRRKHQPSDIFYKKKSDVLICNSGSIKQLEENLIETFLKHTR